MTELTPEQRRAVERRDGSLLVRAGAGTGKTAVLVERFVGAVVDDGAAVESILAITFTEKAAAEMRTRVRRRFIELGLPEQARAAEAAWISTIHGFCSHVLRANALSAGIDPDFRVQMQALGASRLRSLWAVAVEARLPLLAAVMAGFGAAVSEVGAAMMVGGNIAGETRVLTTAAVLETSKGNLALAVALGLILLLLAFMVNLVLTLAQQRGRP